MVPDFKKFVMVLNLIFLVRKSQDNVQELKLLLDTYKVAPKEQRDKIQVRFYILKSAVVMVMLTFLLKLIFYYFFFVLLGTFFMRHL